MLDDISKQIIAMLQKDGRCPYTTIAKNVGLSEAAVRQRIARMLKDKSIAILAVADPPSAGFTAQAMLGLSVQGPIQELSNRLALFDEVIYVVITSGSFDLLVEVFCKTDQELIEFVDDHIRCDSAVSAVQIMRYLSVKKQDHSWGYLPDN